MSDGWHFYRFDHARYLALRPALRSATSPQAFAALAENAETDAIVEGLQAGEFDFEAARQAFVQALCCPGDPLPLDQGLPKLVSALGRRRETEDAAELLGELLAGRKNREAWLPDRGFLGYLTPDETVKLSVSYNAALQRGSLRTGARRKGRRGGLLGGVIRFTRQLLDREPPLEEILPILADFIADAAAHEDGIAVYAV